MSEKIPKTTAGNRMARASGTCAFGVTNRGARRKKVEAKTVV